MPCRAVPNVVQGCGLVTMAAHPEAVAAIEALDGKFVWEGMDCPMVVKVRQLVGVMRKARGNRARRQAPPGALLPAREGKAGESARILCSDLEAVPGIGT